MKKLIKKLEIAIMLAVVMTVNVPKENIVDTDQEYSVDIQGVAPDEDNDSDIRER